jgi:hypothetical protein
MTNYRKSGESFQNLQMLRPVHDSNGVYRFCMSVQVELEHNDVTATARLVQLEERHSEDASNDN